MPENLKLSFPDYCETCQLFVPEFVEFYAKDFNTSLVTEYRLTCKHLEACQRCIKLSQEIQSL